MPRGHPGQVKQTLQAKRNKLLKSQKTPSLATCSALARLAKGACPTRSNRDLKEAYLMVESLNSRRRQREAGWLAISKSRPSKSNRRPS